MHKICLMNTTFFRLRNAISCLAILLTLSATLAAKPAAMSDAGAAPVLADRPSVALVLGGGGAKGFSHLPILSMLEAMDIPIDMVIGTSIGAIVGGLYAAGYSPLQIAEEFSDVNWPKILTDSVHSPYESLLAGHSKYALPLTVTFDYDFNLKLGKGISSGQQVYQLFRNMTLKYPSNISFDQLPIPFRAIATDAATGEAFVLQDGDVAEAMRASMSLPGVFDPFDIDGMEFMDGGLRYNLAINVAKDMGYDIIIAVDISQQADGSMEYESNPMMAILNSITITQKFVTEPLYQEATIIIKPDTQDYGILDFMKAEEIYQAGNQAATEYQAALEDIRRRIYPQDYDGEGNRLSPYKPPRTNGSYEQQQQLTISSVTLEGALPSDEEHLLGKLERLHGKTLNQTTLEEILHLVYMTGNYQTVIPRSIQQGDKIQLAILLSPRKLKTVKASLGVDFRLTTGLASSSQFNLSPEIQFRGLTGPASAIAIKGTFVDDLGGKFLYFQPLSPYIFAQLDSDFHQDKYARTSQNKNIPALVQEITRWRNELSFGFRTLTNNLLRVRLFHHYLDTNQHSFAQDLNLVALMHKAAETTSHGYRHLHDVGLQLGLVLDLQEKHVFAEQGFYGNFWTKIFFPLDNPSVERFAVISAVDLRYAIPLGSRFVVSLKGFAGFDVMERMQSFPDYIMLEGFNNYDRAYFPQIPSEDRYGIHKAAMGISLQFKPLPWLTILGGDLFLRANATVGNVANKFSNLIPGASDSTENPLPDDLLWSSSLGVGLRVSDSFTIHLRGGAGATSRGRVTPFLAIDVGNLWF